MRNRIIQGDALLTLKTLSDNLVDCVVTSPPYWNLRNYGIEGQLGLEKTPQEYISKMGEIFREVRRVLKPEGTLWLNLGDSYMASATGNQGNGSSTLEGGKSTQVEAGKRPSKICGGLKTKDLVGIPWRVALALQADGWWLRSDIIWSKPNPMPESVTDRPTRAHEYLFLLTKSQKYFFDQEAVREPWVEYERARRLREKENGLDTVYQTANEGKIGQTPQGQNGAVKNVKRRGELAEGNGRNIHSVWTIATQPFPQFHFATFPEALVEPCIKAGTSERGYCPECGKPWVWMVDRAKVGDWNKNRDRFGRGNHQNKNGDDIVKINGSPYLRGYYPPRTLGWSPSCDCNKDPIPPLVLDPFSGAGTVALVAKRLLRDYIGIELKPDYITMSEKRLAMTAAQTRLF